MMYNWYHFGRGKNLIKNGVDILYFQRGSDGYESVIRGDSEFKGKFELVEINNDNETALVHSTIPFNLDMERGILIGGVLPPEDIEYAKVTNDGRKFFFKIEFHKNSQASKKKIDSYLINHLNKNIKLSKNHIDDLCWKYKILKLQMNRKNLLWEATNENLSIAYNKLDKQSNEVSEIFYKVGMADAFIDFIHNMGNTLNSLNTPTDSIKKIIIKSKLEKLSIINHLLEIHSNNLIDFLTKNKKGNQIFEYLNILENILNKGNDKKIEEIDRIKKCIVNIKRILDAQGIYTNTNNIIEEFDIIPLIESAIRLQNNSFFNNNIKISRKNFEKDNMLIKGKKSKLINVIIELFKNSIEAMSFNEINNRSLEILLQKNGNMTNIKITDNGVGIPSENKTKIFNHGFTTKQNRYGFGLHNCANYINEMNVSVEIIETSPGKGTTIMISLQNI